MSRRLLNLLTLIVGATGVTLALMVLLPAVAWAQVNWIWPAP